MAKALFLHSGPGFSCYVERLRLGPKFPDVVFWDQPRTYGPTAYTDLVNCTHQKIVELTDESGEPIHIIGFSFGGLLAQEVKKKSPDRFRKTLLISFVPNVLNAFQNLLHHICTASRCERQLASQIETFMKGDHSSDSVMYFMEMMSQLIQIPDYMSYYWASQRAYLQYKFDASKGPQLDVNHFLDTLSERLRLRHHAPYATEEPVEMLYGEKDPFVVKEQVIKALGQTMPNAQMQFIEDVGHYPQFEWPHFPDYLSKFLS